MFLVEEEGTASSFRGLAEVVARKGLFCALYTGCRRSSGWPASSASTPPTAGWPRSICPSTTPFAVAAEQDGSAFVADAAQAWREILCIQEEPQVGNDNTVKPNLQWPGKGSAETMACAGFAGC